jgi:16S rRNA (uracil1498-N3)-methyltransferase
MPGFRPRFFVAADDSAGGEQSVVASGADLSGTEWLLGPEDSHHAMRVLRLGPGDECEVVVGAAVYAATVAESGTCVRVRLAACLEGATAGASYRIQVGLAQALIRPALVDHVIEKATEAGASFFLLVRVAGSPPWSGTARSDRLARWQRIALEAAKQSKHTVVPTVELAGSLEQALAAPAGEASRDLVLDPRAPADIRAELEAEGPVSGRVRLWSGPEGGWSSAELAGLEAAGATPVRLGRGVLRAETAGPVAVAVTRLLLRDW